MNIIIVDDNTEFRSTLRFFIEEKLNHTVIAEAESGEEFLKMDSNLLVQADIILMDIVMNELSGIETTQRVTWEHNYLKVIAVTMHVEKVFLQQILEAGFKGCVYKTDIFNTLEDALQKVHTGQLYLNEDLLK